MPKKKKLRSNLQGNISLLSGSDRGFASDHVQLLVAIDRCGSISSAAKEVGISYKTAWDRIEAMNNMSRKSLVIRSAGGARGGGSSVTDYGKKVIEGFLSLQEEHETFLQRLGSRVLSLNDVANFIRSGTMQTSARNQYRGTVENITPGAVNVEITLRISTSQTLTAMVTEESRRQLGLKKGSGVIALIKASSILLSKDTGLISSARNKLAGTIKRVTPGAVNSDVVIDLGEGKSVSAIITNTSLSELDLKQGEPACAFFKASSVILMADG